MNSEENVFAKIPRWLEAVEAIQAAGGLSWFEGQMLDVARVELEQRAMVIAID